MKKNALLFFFLIQCFYGFTQVTKSVLSEGTWFKFSIDTTGVFKIDKNLLGQIGVDVNNIDPRKIHIYGNGGNLLPNLNSAPRYDDLKENAIYIEGEGDGSFDANDFILFYAKGPHDWVVDSVNKTAKHRQNIYSDKGYYFIKVDASNGKRVTNKTPLTNTSTQQLTTFNDFVFYEKEQVNLFAAGSQWFGESFAVENKQNFKIPFNNSVQNSAITVNVNVVSASTSTTFFDVTLNNQNNFKMGLPLISPSGLTKAGTTFKSITFNNSANEIDVVMTYDNAGNPSSKAYLDYIEIIGEKQLIVNDKQFSFRNFNQATLTGIAEYSIQNATNIFQLWDVTDPINPAKINNESSGGNFTFKSNNGVLKEFIVLNESDFYVPEAIKDGKVANQNLHGLQDVNYLVITSSELSEQAQRLADYHQENSNLTSKVVILEEIYNEFASGSKDITGIRDFIKHLYSTNTVADKKLKYVCFFGDASYDYKDRITENNNIIPVYEAFNSFNLAFSYVTDDYFVMLEDDEGIMRSSDTVDVTSGRIPVSDLQQAKEVVDKILSYYNLDSFGDWRNTVTFLADDIDANSDISLQSGVEKIADSVRSKKPIFNVNKIYADAFKQENSSGGERYPQVSNAITNAIEKGTLLLDYFGHGGEDGFASERFLEKTQIQSFNNPKTLPLLVTVTCEFSRFDNPNRETAGELTFWNPNGGAVSMITTTREVFISTGQSFNEDLVEILLEFNDEDLTIAESLAKAKNEFPGSIQKFFIYYFGDPAMKLAIPQPNVKITKMNGVDITQKIDTLKALSNVSFEGVVTNNSNNTLTDFNGTLSTIIFDKPIEKSTLDNDGFGIKNLFDTQDSKMFRGKSTVQNGKFKFDFIVPKDIKVAFGNGKLSFYAENGKIDKAGSNFDIIVGGINKNAPDDSVGPEVNLFMNDESFIDGGNVNASPNIIVKLSDISGINTSITAIDHDIVAVLDGDDSNPIVLNDFYETELNDFTKGKVTYKLRDLSVGNHTLKIKAWDTYNNSSEATLNFVVVSDAIFNLENVLNYPNPFVNYTEFWFNHNKPNEPLEVQVQIFTVSGKLIKTINQTITTTGNLSRSITWNGLDDFGNRIGKGVYIYKLKVKSTINNLSAEKYEKLVILQ
ncbi:putative secreted protein (Por secretion system target) [Lutibacter sp. Hel_I_33_5]|uniref:type IX secretion system sortase PorU n=1 Tax=Lutibacter sp. Hel_I_33_5 TaxID=1566289 RepID=UPI0011A7A07B|nr:type IX secretion system sortase PorU [Lutibacter sp. Hel_I_33_5]TVZ55480.1 putative secreted protein (Por secretion system target) [Lutibacter sp. Hel_I_33_5]